MASALPCEISRPVNATIPSLKDTLGPFPCELLTSGLSVGVASATTNPIDVCKVRMQTNGGGIYHTARDMVRAEGASSLFKGMTPSVARAVFYGGMRLGMYGPIKSSLTTEGQATTVSQKLAAGSLSGAVAAGISNPTDLVKTRLQTKGSHYATSMQVIRHIVATDGVAGLWKGTVPSMARAALLTASQCVSYDIIKRQVIATTGAPDTLGTHITASMLTGLVSTTVTSPADVIKTRMFVAGAGFSGPWACAVDIFARDGAAGFFKGWTANYARLGPQTMITFVVVEQLRSWAGLNSM